MKLKTSLVHTIASNLTYVGLHVQEVADDHGIPREWETGDKTVDIEVHGHVANHNVEDSNVDEEAEEAGEDREEKRGEDDQEAKEHKILEWTKDGMHVDTIEVEMTEHEEDDDYNDKVKIIIETTSGTETQKTADKWKDSSNPRETSTEAERNE